jgi:phosphate transport system permease protein
MTKTDFPIVKPKGEAYVWMTASGLAVGIVMIVFLLGMIFVNGITVFWPKPIHVFELSPSSDARIHGAPMIGGEIRRIQEKIVPVLDPTGKPLPAEREIQVFTGNKDLYGFSFRFIDEKDIVSRTRPENILNAERIEYGNALMIPIALQLADGSQLDAEDPLFSEVLDRLINESNTRREAILLIEKVEIGKINAKLEDLRLNEKRLMLETDTTHPKIQEKLERIVNERALLQAKYETLAAQSRLLRNQQNDNQLQYKAITGEQKTLPIGAFMGVYAPNKLSMLQKIGLFFHNMTKFLVDDPREANTEGGIFPAIFGTFVMTLLLSIAVTPFGVMAAIYLREYAKQGFMVRCVRIAVNNLAGVPSIVFGVFGLGFFVYFLGGTIDKLFFALSLPTPTFGTGGILWAALTLALMTVPVVIVSTEEALSAVPRGVREGSLACGASKWQTIQRLVLPASAPGILTGLILAMARGAGEVAPLMLVGVVKLAPTLPLDSVFPFFHLDRKFMHLGFHIYDLGFQSPDSEAAKPMVFATTFILILLVIVLNLGAILLRNHLRKKYKGSTF